MGSGKKEKVNLNRTEALARMQAVLDELKRGSFTVADESFAIPDQVRLEIEARRGKIELEVKWTPEEREAEPPAAHP